jgi:hypothetical protein
MFLFGLLTKDKIGSIEFKEKFGYTSVTKAMICYTLGEKTISSQCKKLILFILYIV